jgi:hypothetical protein
LPRDATLWLEHTAFIVRQGLSAEVVATLRKFLKTVDRNSRQARWARRALAVALASAGGESNAREALQLHKGAGLDDSETRRTRARAAIGGQRNRLDAIGLLEGEGSTLTVPVADQVLLAGLYEAAE